VAVLGPRGRAVAGGVTSTVAGGVDPEPSADERSRREPTSLEMGSFIR
jgi:hypothetical protein